jgi:hypothetical protein
MKSLEIDCRKSMEIDDPGKSRKHIFSSIFGFITQAKLCEPSSDTCTYCMLELYAAAQALSPSSQARPSQQNEESSSMFPKNLLVARAGLFSFRLNAQVYLVSRLPPVQQSIHPGVYAGATHMRFVALMQESREQ